MKINTRLLFIISFLFTFMATPALADTALEAEAKEMNEVTLSKGQEHVVQKIASDYQGFLEPNDAEEVVTGLCTGTEFQYNGEIYAPPTGKMGYGNVYVSLGLAQQTGDLNQVLQMRSEGKGWGEIAHELDLNVGEVMSGMKSANKQFATNGTEGVSTTEATGGGITSATTSTSGHGKGKALGRGIVSGEGTPIGSSQGNAGKSQSGKANKGPQGNQYGKGIVSGSGAPVGSSSGGIPKGSGIVTGSGSSAGAIHSSGKSSPKGLAKGHNK